MEVIKNLDGNKLTLSIVGRIDTTTSPDLENIVTKSIGTNISKLVIDLKKTEYISSAGLRVILAAHKIMSKQGTMYIINTPQTIRDVFEITGFDSVLNIE